MIAVDTNVVVRLIVGDDDAQVHAALTLAARGSLFVSLTVVIETEWVLRSRYGYDRATIARAFLALSDLVALVYEDAEGVRWAMARYALAGELADYLHMVAARPVGRFASFERRLAKRAGADAPVVIELPT